MKIDFHTHCFPDALAPRAMASLSQTFYTLNGLTALTDGTAGDAKRLLQTAGVDAAVVCNIATNPHQEAKVNGFAIELAQRDPFFHPLGSLHPDSEQMEAELDRLQAAGIGGIKLHPDYVRIELTDRRFDRIFSLLEARGMFCVLHTGFDPISPDHIHATPQMLARVIEGHPRLTLIAAHMGGYAQASEVLRYLVGKNIYLDTSLCAMRTSEREMLLEILHRHPKDRLLFATDTPWGNVKDELAFLSSAGLSPERLEHIYFKNACALLGRQ